MHLSHQFGFFKQFFIQVVPFADDVSENFSFVDSLQYDFENIRSATDGFSDANKLGQGGFGAVYKVIKHVLHIYDNLNTYPVNRTCTMRLNL